MCARGWELAPCPLLCQAVEQALCTAVLAGCDDTGELVCPFQYHCPLLPQPVLAKASAPKWGHSWGTQVCRRET